MAPITVPYQELLALSQNYPNPLAAKTIRNQGAVCRARKPRIADLEPSAPRGAVGVSLGPGTFPLLSCPQRSRWLGISSPPATSHAFERTRARHTRPLYGRQLWRIDNQLEGSYPPDQRDHLLLMAVENSSVLAANHQLPAGRR